MLNALVLHWPLDIDSLRYRQNYLSKRLDPFNIGSGQYFFLLVLSKNNGNSQEGLSDFLKMIKRPLLSH